MKILGITSSLRGARFGLGGEQLCAEVKSLKNRDELIAFLVGQTKIRYQEFFDYGREAGRPFDEVYTRLRKLKGDRGLSNSEAALAAGLWGVIQEGLDIEQITLSSHFPDAGGIRNESKLRQTIMEADGILLSGPVYFGDRGSLSQSFIELLDRDSELKAHIKDKVYVGLAVGAKRNGGQETTLIYQLLDMVNMGMLAVGNNSDTTSQYGGTGVAGDVGTFGEDHYGIDTCVGSGQRIARVTRLMRQGASRPLQRKLKLDLWVLQDTMDKRGMDHFGKWREDLLHHYSDEVEIRIRDFTDETVFRCIACDTCPETSGAAEDYRCIIKSGKDFFKNEHASLVDTDAILLSAYSPRERSTVRSVYQRFIERTRYLRRDNYAFGDRLLAPFVISELSSRQNLHLRMLTSGLRHHTLLHHPLLGIELDGRIINEAELIQYGVSFVDNARKFLAGRYVEGGREEIIYYPLGYEISSQQVQEDIHSGRTAANVRSRIKLQLG